MLLKKTLAVITSWKLDPPQYHRKLRLEPLKVFVMYLHGPYCKAVWRAVGKGNLIKCILLSEATKTGERKRERSS